MATVYLGKKKMLTKLTFFILSNIQMLFSFCEVLKRHSDQLLHLFFKDRRESVPKAITYLTETVLRFTTDDFQSMSPPIEQLTMEVAIML
jgi:hypothetical protein